MYEESVCFDPTSLQDGLVQAEDDFSQAHMPNCNNNHNFSMEEQSYPQTNQISPQQVAAASAMEMELPQQLNVELEQFYINKNDSEMQGTNNTTQLIQEIVHNANWHEMGNFNGENQYHQQHQPNADIQIGHHHQNFTSVSLPDTPYPATPDLLNMFPLPRCSPSFMLPDSSITFSNSAQKSPSFLASLGLLGDINPVVDGTSASASVVYDPLLPLNLPSQPPLLRELFQSLPQGCYALGGLKNGSLFGGVVDDRDHVNGGLYQDGDGRHFDNGVFEFTAGDMDCLGKNNGKHTKHFSTEKHRRVLFNDKYQALRKLVPSPTKNDRASIVGDAIVYINELKRTVNELKVLMEKKRCSKERLKRPKTETDGIEGNDLNTLGEMDQPYNGSSLRSSWLYRKSKNTEVDVRIIEDEVTVKLVHQKRINCLLFVSKVLDELQLDLHHVAGGLIGDYYSFLFNSKICEGSKVYASAIANKLIEVVDKQYAAIPSTNSY